MAIEIEKKYNLTSADVNRLLLRLADINATFVGEDFEVNAIYRGGDLGETGAILRIRSVADRTLLTYKRRIKDSGEIKQQIEHETSVENSSSIEKIIESLGFEKSVVYEKRRRTWRFRDAEIVLDELPFGLYMEIEGSEDSIVEAEKILKAENLIAEHDTYPRLAARFGKTRQNVIEARFPKKNHADKIRTLPQKP